MFNVQATDGYETENSSDPIQLPSSNLSAFLEISPDALILIDQAGTIVMINQQAETLFGYPRTHLLYQPLEQLLPERFRNSHREHRMSYFSTPSMRPMGADLPLFGLRRDGIEFPVDISLKPLLLDTRLVALAAIRDISAQRTLEEELHRAHEASLFTLNKVLSATAEYVFLIDLHGRYLFASDQVAAFFGIPQHDFVGKTWQELGLPVEFMTSFEEHYQALLSTGQEAVGEILFPHRTGGRWFEYVVKPLLNQQGALEAVIMAAQDVTERRQAADLERRLASIVASSDDAIIGKDLNGIIVSWNKGAERLYGYRAHEVEGKSISLLIPPELLDDFSAIMGRLQRGEHITHYETVRMKKDGSRVEVSVSISPIKASNGIIIGASSIARDITERKRAEDTLKRSRDELKEVNTALAQANRVRSQFLATMSHELRTPLASIIGFSEMLLEDAMKTETNQQQRSNLTSILRNSEHLLSLINDVLDLSKMEAGRMVLDSRSVDVRNLLDSLTREIEPLALARHLFLRTDVEEGIDCLNTDQGKLYQILQNLVSNALRFTEQGGVTLTATRVLHSDTGDVRIAFAVKDSGIGMPPDIQERIFEAFYQADMSYTRKAGGTGLGLSIVSQLTALMGGTITVESALGQGSTFTVILPLQAPSRSMSGDLPRLHPLLIQPQNITTTPAVHEFVSESQEAVEGQQDLILAVDDNPDIVTLIQNAHKYTPNGGSITLSVESVGANACIAVADTGIGLSTEEQARLFTRFYRANNAITKSVDGTGLGLTITQMLVEMQGGEIQVTSVPGHGSTFRFTLPLALRQNREISL